MRYSTAAAATVAYFLSLSGPVRGANIQLTTGDVGAPGFGMFFHLIAPDGSDLKVVVPIAFIETLPNATAKARTIAAIVNADPSWNATQDFARLQFFHLEAGVLKPVEIYGLFDTTQEDSRITAVASASGGVFDFGLDNTRLATGFDGNGHPSFLVFSTTVDAFTVPIHTGETGQGLIDTLFSDLAMDGVNIVDFPSIVSDHGPASGRV